MPSFNEVILMGNVTRDPQLKALANGSQVVDFGLAVNRKYRTQSGEDREEVCFVDCAAFGKQAEVLSQYVTKGKPLFVSGRLKYDAWEDKQGGKRSKLSIVVENFQFIGGRDGGAAVPDRSGQRGDESRGRPGRADNPDGEPPPFDPMDIPF